MPVSYWIRDRYPGRLPVAGCVRSLADRKTQLDIAPDRSADDSLSAIPSQVHREDKAPVSLLDFRKLPNTGRFRPPVGEFLL
jgi:hypothetical protein